MLQYKEKMGSEPLPHRHRKRVMAAEKHKALLLRIWLLKRLTMQFQRRYFTSFQPTCEGKNASVVFVLAVLRCLSTTSYPRDDMCYICVSVGAVMVSPSRPTYIFFLKPDGKKMKDSLVFFSLI